MEQENSEKISTMFSKAQESLNEIAELNAKSLKEFVNMQSMNFSTSENPEDLFKKQVNFAIENSQKTVNYIQKVQKITEKALLYFVTVDK